MHHAASVSKENLREICWSSDKIERYH